MIAYLSIQYLDPFVVLRPRSQHPIQNSVQNRHTNKYLFDADLPAVIYILISKKENRIFPDPLRTWRFYIQGSEENKV